MPHPVDLHVGRRVRDIRLRQKLSQQALARKVGLHVSQIQKYECGSNRISASNLFLIGDAFGVHPTTFFVGLAGKHETEDPQDGSDLLINAEAFQLITFFKTMSPGTRHSFLKLVKAIVPCSEDDNLGES